MKRAYKQHTYPNITLINQYAIDTNMDKRKWVNYQNKYYRYKKIENKYLNQFRLTEKELEEHLSIGDELEELLKEILKK